MDSWGPGSTLVVPAPMSKEILLSYPDVFRNLLRSAERDGRIIFVEGLTHPSIVT